MAASSSSLATTVGFHPGPAWRSALPSEQAVGDAAWVVFDTLYLGRS